MNIVIGATGSARMVVGGADTAIALGSGDVPVLGTPRLVALMEAAAVTAVAGDLPPETTSVGTRIDIEHRAPTAIGEEVVAVAEIMGHSRRTITFAVTATSASGLVGEGTHTRVIVDRERFPG